MLHVGGGHGKGGDRDSDGKRGGRDKRGRRGDRRDLERERERERDLDQDGANQFASRFQSIEEVLGQVGKPLDFHDGPNAAEEKTYSDCLKASLRAAIWKQLSSLQEGASSSLGVVIMQVMAVAKDQNGCRFLQRKFDEGGPAAIQAVLPEVLEHLIELMMDPFGNYLIQKLLDRCSEDQRLAVSIAFP